jgi:hypothetical protein
MNCQRGIDKPKNIHTRKENIIQQLAYPESQVFVFVKFPTKKEIMNVKTGADEYFSVPNSCSFHTKNNWWQLQEFLKQTYWVTFELNIKFDEHFTSYLDEILLLLKNGRAYYFSSLWFLTTTTTTTATLFLHFTFKEVILTNINYHCTQSNCFWRFPKNNLEIF